MSYVSYICDTGVILCIYDYKMSHLMNKTNKSIPISYLRKYALLIINIQCKIYKFSLKIWNNKISYSLKTILGEISISIFGDSYFAECFDKCNLLITINTAYHY